MKRFIELVDGVPMPERSAGPPDGTARAHDERTRDARAPHLRGVRDPHLRDGTGGTDHVTRVCFRLQVAAEHLDAYRARHATVWPSMLQAIAVAGRRNYSLFLDDDGLLIGYYETDSVADADAALAASEVAAAWESHMLELFDGAAGRADQVARVLPEVFNLEDQLAAARAAGVS